jgi:hypothetical protein
VLSYHFVLQCIPQTAVRNMAVAGDFLNNLCRLR